MDFVEVSAWVKCGKDKNGVYVYMWDTIYKGSDGNVGASKMHNAMANGEKLVKMEWRRIRT